VFNRNCQHSGDFLIEAASAAQGNCISKLTSLANFAVTVRAHRTLNTFKGVIKCRDLIDCDKAEILEKLKSQDVSDINTITVKGNDGSRRNTYTFIVTFRLPTLPKHIKIGYLRVPVAVYVPNPLRCFKCQRFGHGQKVCRTEVVCVKCGQTGHSDRDCRNEVKCPNCSGSHSAFSRDCPKWKQEKQVQFIKAEKGVSFPEARRLASSGYTTSSVSQTCSMAAVVKQGIPTSRLSVCSVHIIQTELTWPNSQESPTTVLSISVSLQTSDAEQPVPSTSSAKSPNRGSNSQSKGKGKNNAPTIKHPPRFSDNPVTMYNRYSALDAEDSMESVYFSGCLFLGCHGQVGVQDFRSA